MYRDRGRSGERQQTPCYINKHCCEQSGSCPHSESRMEEPARWKLRTSGRCFTMLVYIQVCICTVLYLSVKYTEHWKMIQFSFGGSCDRRTWLTFWWLCSTCLPGIWEENTDTWILLPVSFIHRIVHPTVYTTLYIHNILELSTLMIQ